MYSKFLLAVFAFFLLCSTEVSAQGPGQLNPDHWYHKKLMDPAFNPPPVTPGGSCTPGAQFHSGQCGGTWFCNCVGVPGNDYQTNWMWQCHYEFCCNSYDSVNYKGCSSY